MIETRTEPPASSPPASQPPDPHGLALRRGRFGRLLAPAVGPVLLAVTGLELLNLYNQIDLIHLVTRAGVLVFVIVGMPYFRIRERALLSVSSLLAIMLFTLAPVPWSVFAAALDQAALLIAFVLLLGLLQEGASKSPAVLTAGAFLTMQPPGRRFTALFIGSHLLGVLVNLGTVSLLAPLIQRGVRKGLPAGAPLDEISQVRERRQLSAVLRGFGWMVVWSPTAVAPAILVTVMEGIDRIRLSALGLMIACVMLGLGWLEDRIRWRGLRRQLMADGRLTGGTGEPVPWRSFRDLASIFFMLTALTGLLMLVAGVTILPALMLAVPFFLTGWLFMEHDRAEPFSAARETVLDLREILVRAVPLSASVSMTLGASGFIGTVAAALLPAREIANAIGLELLPAWVFLSLLPVAVVLSGQLGVSPIMMAVFFGTVLGSLPSLPADPTLTALALGCGWGLSMVASPFASVVLLTSRVTGIAGTRLTWSWNLPYAIAAIVVLSFIFLALTGGS